MIQAYIKMVDIWLIFAQVKLLAWISSNMVCWVLFVVDVAMHYITVIWLMINTVEVVVVIVIVLLVVAIVCRVVFVSS